MSANLRIGHHEQGQHLARCCRVVVTLGFMMTLLLVACTSRDSEPISTVASIDDLPAEVHVAIDEDPTLRLGFAVYSRNCIGCHGVNGDGKGPAAVRLGIAPRDFTAGIFKFRSTPNGQLPLDEDLHRTLIGGLNGTSMPAFELLPDRERQAVIDFIKLYSERWDDPNEVVNRVLIPSAAPPDLMTRERVLRGRFGYVGMGCNLCHGLGGRGDGPSAMALKDDWGQIVAPYNYHQGAPKTGSDPLAIYRTFRTGVTPMPMYESNTLGLVTRDLKSIVFARLVDEEKAELEPIVDALPTMAEVQAWPAERFEAYSNERAWDLVAFTLWLRERNKPTRAAIWPERKSTPSTTHETDQSSEINSDDAEVQP